MLDWMVIYLNISALAVGQSRDLVILNLGQPTKPWLADNKRTDVFELERGNQQSIGRATGHAVMDRLTLGGWELIGTPLEGLAGDTMTRQIEDDEENTGRSVITVESNQAFSLKSQGRSTISLIVWTASCQVKRISPTYRNFTGNSCELSVNTREEGHGGTLR